MALGLGIASLAESGTVPGDAPINHHLADVRAVEVADPGAAVVCARPVKLAPDRPTLRQLDQGLTRLGAAGFIPLRHRESAQADRHTPSSIVSPSRTQVTSPTSAPRTTLSSRGGPREHQKAGEQAEEAAVHDLLITNAQVEDLDASCIGTTAMAIVTLPLSPGAEARAPLHHLLEHGDFVGSRP